jgi:hypothetical protein
MGDFAEFWAVDQTEVSQPTTPTTTASYTHRYVILKASRKAFPLNLAARVLPGVSLDIA